LKPSAAGVERKRRQPITTADVVIVGAGFAGAATAYHLKLQSNARVIIIEREPVPGAHASGKNAAMAFTALQDPFEAKLAVEGRGFIEGRACGLQGDGMFRRCGSLLVATSSGALERAGGEAAGAGIEVARLAPKDAAEIVAPLGECGLVGAIWNAADGVVDIHALLQDYLRGQDVWYNCCLTGVNLRDGRVDSVDTTRGPIAAGVVVNAAGAWAEEVGRAAGAARLKFTPRRRHLFQTMVELEVRANWPFVWHLDIESYFRPEGSGLLMSPCDEDVHPPVEPTTSEEAQETLARKVCQAFPPLSGAGIASAWACLRTFSADGRFVIGADPCVQGFFWVAGLGGHGMTTSSGVGRLAAAAVLGHKVPELDSFAPGRLLG